MNYRLKDNEIPRQLSWPVETKIGLTNKNKNNQIVLPALFDVNSTLSNTKNPFEKQLEMLAIIGCILGYRLLAAY